MIALGFLWFFNSFKSGISNFKVNKNITSPTFTLLKSYDVDSKSIKHIYHFDLYRIKSIEELLDIGFEEYLYIDNSILKNLEESFNIYSSSIAIGKSIIVPPSEIDGLNKRISRLILDNNDNNNQNLFNEGNYENPFAKQPYSINNSQENSEASKVDKSNKKVIIIISIILIITVEMKIAKKNM